MTAGYDLDRFISAQRGSYETALAEIRRGRKDSHWMWYIFPQLRGLGRSYTANLYGIADLQEAAAYFAEPTLGARLIEISRALLELEECNATAVFGKPDDMKLRSSMTLFALAAPECDVFQKVLDKFFEGKRDHRTLSMLGM